MTKAGKQIRNLLLIFGGGMVAAVLLSYLMVVYYSPTTLFPAGNLLLAPEVVKNLSFDELNRQDNRMVKFRFERIEVLYYEGSNWKREQIDLETYSKIYNLIKNDKSLANPKNVFQDVNPLTLTIVVRNADQTRAFQELQTVSDTYRVMLKEEGASPNWAYFEHPHIYQDIMKVIKK